MSRLSLAIATREALLLVRPGSTWTVEQHLEDEQPESIGIDPDDPSRLYAGTWGSGLWRSEDSGRSWHPSGVGIHYSEITAVAVERKGKSLPGVVYAGTEPSTLSRSDDGGESWRELVGLLELPSSSDWSFPPKPETHHVRWIETDPNVQDKVYVAIEAGALVRSLDKGESWLDRVRGGPIDTHTAASHQGAPGRIYSAAGDGYFESEDSGESWLRYRDGLRHGYMVGVAVDPGDPDIVVVSGAAGPYVSYRPSNAEAFVYRKSARQPFELAMDGLPDAKGTVASRLATHLSEPGVFYAANNLGLFRSSDSGQTWAALEIDWPDGAFASGIRALTTFIE